jgi:hypothetical protein
MAAVQKYMLAHPDEFRGRPGARGEPGIPGSPGAPPSKEEIRKMIREELAARPQKSGGNSSAMWVIPALMSLAK